MTTPTDRAAPRKGNVILRNPTDAQLENAFAEHVAGFLSIRHGYGYPNKDATGVVKVPPFTRSADAVLPWLEKHDAIVTHSVKEADWRVVILGGRCDSDKSFPRAAVICLLRANGVTVTFDT